MERRTINRSSSISNIQDSLGQADTNPTNLTFSEIPRALDETNRTEETFFRHSSQRRSTFFEPVSSELEYCDLYSPPLREQFDMPHIPTKDQERVWHLL
jgi:hypothetical protein